MKIPFYKMHGAGNDFVMVDDRSLSFPVSDREFIARRCARRTGVGCDGILLLQPSDAADLRMRFINPDGNEVEMCGNGARCVARLAFDLGIAAGTMTIGTGAGLVRAQVSGEAIRLDLTEPTDWRFDLEVGLDEPVSAVNTGVPHAIVWVDDLEAVDVAEQGRHLRFHPLFAPEGTNANFVRLEADGSLSVRTYERGVEGETLACGTGAAAAALMAARCGKVELPVAVHCASGYDLMVDSHGPVTTLSGTAEYVFEGEMGYGDRI